MSSLPISRRPTQAILLALVLFGPFIAACFIYFANRPAAPFSADLHGTVLRPPLSTQTLALNDLIERPTHFQTHWQWIRIDLNCDSPCQKQLVDFNQTSHRHITVSLVTRKSNATVQARYLKERDLAIRVLSIEPEALAHFLKNAGLTEKISQPTWWLVNPQQDLMITYPIDTPFSVMLADLNQLTRSR